MKIPYKYIKGDAVGSNGITFIFDISLSKPRKALFKCYCGKEWVTNLMNIKSNKTISCGCIKASKWAFLNRKEVLKSKKTRTCKICKKEKPVSKFEYSINPKKERIYIGARCENCGYKYKLANYNLKAYTKKHREREHNTILGRARMLRNRAQQRTRLRTSKNTYIFNLSLNKVVELLTPLKCQATGIPLELENFDLNPYAPSVDRINNSKGYTDDNIQIVCMIYNFCKNEFTDNQVKEFFKKIKLHDIQS